MVTSLGVVGGRSERMVPTVAEVGSWAPRLTIYSDIIPRDNSGVRVGTRENEVFLRQSEGTFHVFKREDPHRYDQTLTKLEVSWRAADRFAYLPSFPTVIAPRGGLCKARAAIAKDKSVAVMRAMLGATDASEGECQLIHNFYTVSREHTVFGLHSVCVVHGPV